MKSDFLVIGGGIAGLSFAIQASAHGSVTLLCKGNPNQSNTHWAQGGIASVLPNPEHHQGDHIDLHIQDTIEAGGGLCDPEAVKTILGQGAEAIAFLVAQKTQFDQENQKYCLTQEGGHSKPRILFSKDQTGKSISEALLLQVQQINNIQLLSDHCAIDLISDPKKSTKIIGVYALNCPTQEIQTFQSNHTILATGGCSKTYLYTTNPDGATGDGLAMAWHAGAKLSGLEFMQFHPTCFYNPAATKSTGRGLLISEALRGEGAKLLNANQKTFMQDYHPRGELASRDVVARAIDDQIKQSGHPCVYLDITHKPKGWASKRFPYIYQTLLTYQIDIETMPIPVVPAAHYQCGGIVTDLFGKTNLKQLYAIGETAYTGLHGANRLASNSLLEGAVMATRTLQGILKNKPATLKAQETLEIAPYSASNCSYQPERVMLTHSWDEVRRLMQDYVSIVRSQDRLKKAQYRIKNLQAEIQKIDPKTKPTKEWIELKNLITTASLIVQSALNRKESRGLHYLVDYPETNPVGQHHIIQSFDSHKSS